MGGRLGEEGRAGPGQRSPCRRVGNGNGHPRELECLLGPPQGRQPGDPLWPGIWLSPQLACERAQAGDSRRDEAGPRALLSHCCAPSSAGRIHKIRSESLVSQLLGVRRHGCLSPNPGDEALSAGGGEEPPTLIGMVSPSQPCSKPCRQGTAALTPSQAPFTWQGLLPPLWDSAKVRGQDVKPQVVRTPACPHFNPKWTTASQCPHTQ